MRHRARFCPGSCPTNAAPGFTLIELLIVIGLTSIFTLSIWQTITFLMASSGNAIREATEMALAVRMADHFRNDVREASEAAVGPGGKSVELALPKSKVKYQCGNDGRLERIENGEVDKGATLCALHFELGPPSRLLRACWVCGDEPKDPNPRPREAMMEPRVLILDTALRCAGKEGATP